MTAKKRAATKAAPKDTIAAEVNDSGKITFPAGITINRGQFHKLYQLVEHFKDINTFTVYTDSGSGIGPSVHVRFDLFDTDDTQVNITDTRDW